MVECRCGRLVPVARAPRIGYRRSWEGIAVTVAGPVVDSLDTAYGVTTPAAVTAHRSGTPSPLKSTASMAARSVPAFQFVEIRYGVKLSVPVKSPLSTKARPSHR